MTPVTELTLGRFVVVVLRLVLETDEGLGRVAADGRGLVAVDGLGLVTAAEGLRFLTGRFFWAVAAASLSGLFLLIVTGGLMA